MGTWMLQLPKISHRICGHLREIAYRARSMSWWCSRRLYRETQNPPKSNAVHLSVERSAKVPSLVILREWSDRRIS